MDRYQAVTTINKVRIPDNAILKKEIVLTNRTYDCGEVLENYSIKLTQTSGPKSVPMEELTDVNLIHLEGVWDETNSTYGVKEGDPAPFEFEFNGSGLWIGAKEIKLCGIQDLTGIEVRCPDPNGLRMKIKVFVGAKGE